MRWSARKSTFHCIFVLNHRVDVCTPSTRRLLDGAAVRVPHWLICAQKMAAKDVLRPSVPSKVYDKTAYNKPIEVLTRGQTARAAIGSYRLDETFGVYLVVFKADEFRAPTRAEHAAFLQTRLDNEEKTKARRAARKAAGELDDSDGSDSDSESEDDDC